MTHKTAAQLYEEAERAKQIADDLRRQAVEAVAREREASQPREPALDNGPGYVSFSKYQSGRVYSYAAVGWRPDGGTSRWAVTGECTDRFTWNGLLAFVGEANWGSVHQFTISKPLLPEGAGPAVAERMGPFGKVRSTRVVEDASFKGRTPFDPADEW